MYNKIHNLRDFAVYSVNQILFNTLQERNNIALDHHNNTDLAIGCNNQRVV